MLSRVAESLYWMSRYIERAENVTRILAVNFNALLDAPLDDEQGWRPLVVTSGVATLFADCYSEFSARNVIEFMLWNAANPNAVLGCVTLARENARSVREQISSEMWEHLNRLYLGIKDFDHEEAMRSPAEFFVKVREGSHAFQGITHATMNHGDGYEFIQMGKYIERADTTLRILDAKYHAAHEAPDGSPEASLQLISMLKSCSAFEAFRKDNASTLQAQNVLDYLLLSKSFPRAVRYCVGAADAALGRISIDPNRDGAAPAPGKVLGRLVADLEYADTRELLSQPVHAFLNTLQARLGQVGNAIMQTCFSTQVILAIPRTTKQSLLVREQQQQQQQ